MAGNYTVLEWDDKDPAEVINDGVDFAPSLDVGDSLATIDFTFIAQAGLVLTNKRIVGTKAVVTASGGTAGTVGRILCTAVTVGGEVLKQVVKVAVKTKA